MSSAVAAGSRSAGLWLNCSPPHLKFLEQFLYVPFLEAVSAVRPDDSQSQNLLDLGASTGIRRTIVDLHHHPTSIVVSE